MANKRKPCKHCGEFEEVESGMQVRAGFFCSLDHMVEWSAEQGRKKVARAKAKAEKDKRKERARKKSELNRTVKHWRPKAQTMFNRFIRLRDKDLPCISCGSTKTGSYLTGTNWDCGHYRSTGAAPHLRFNELNAHKQCVKCNRDLSGNVVDYRINLVKKIGQDNIDIIENDNSIVRFTVDDYIEVYEKYKAKVKELENAE